VFKVLNKTIYNFVTVFNEQQRVKQSTKWWLNSIFVEEIQM